MTERVELLDHGYLSLVESWGSDERIIESARMSTGKGFLGWGAEETCDACDGDGTGRKARGHGPGSLCPECRGRKTRINKPGDEKLLRYLHENKHATPFEFAGLVVEVKAPIMVFREWHRHRTQSYNEMSARYTPLPDENYVPTPERCLVVAGKNRQAGKAEGAEELTHEKVIAWLLRLSQVYAMSQEVYAEGLAVGIPKELARLPVPVGRYSKMRASTCLRNWLAFMTLRSAPSAQHEIRVYSDAVGQLVGKLFPRTWALFQERQ